MKLFKKLLYNIIKDKLLVYDKVNKFEYIEFKLNIDSVYELEKFISNKPLNFLKNSKEFIDIYKQILRTKNKKLFIKDKGFFKIKETDYILKDVYGNLYVFNKMSFKQIKQLLNIK